MGWERRGNRGRRFYYRSVRIAGRPCKLYMGHGPDARAQAARVAQARDRRRAEREVLHAEQDRVTAADLAFEQARALVDLLVQATLVLNGFHQHRWQWRRRRGHQTHGC
jgi:hypothetical protein